jgi:hypothetical protein
MAEISVPGRLLPLLGVVRRTYPDGVPPDDYKPLLEVLQWRMSERSLAILVAALTGREPAEVAGDSAVLSAGPADSGPGLLRVGSVRDRLDANGWDEVSRGFEKQDVHARISPLPELPDYMVEALDVLRRVYPDGIPGADYYPLLAALSRDCSQRGLASIVGTYTGRHYVIIYNDAGGVSVEVTRRDADRVWQRLLDHGWIPELPIDDDWPPLRDA